MKLGMAILVLLGATAAFAQQQPSLDPALGITTIPLYNGVPPGGSQADPASIPTLTIFKPQPGKATGSAIVIAPGGGYMGLASNLEGRQVADWFTVRGFTAFVLTYRLGPKNLYPIPLQDGERAIRLVRSLASSYSIVPNRIGMIGFSAGGHLAAATATLYDTAPPASPDAVDRLSARPDFLVLGYPWLNAMEPAQNNEITYCSVLRVLTPQQCSALTAPYTPKLHVTSSTPPTFIYATSDDATVPVRASVEFYDAMIHAGAPVEMHLFRHGAHGSGLGSGDATLDQWPALLEQWLRDQGLLTVDPSIAAARPSRSHKDAAPPTPDKSGHS
jgi:acetyl esterase/lipase